MLYTRAHTYSAFIPNTPSLGRVSLLHVSAEQPSHRQCFWSDEKDFLREYQQLCLYQNSTGKSTPLLHQPATPHCHGSTPQRTLEHPLPWEEALLCCDREETHSLKPNPKDALSLGCCSCWYKWTSARSWLKARGSWWLLELVVHLIWTRECNPVPHMLENKYTCIYACISIRLREIRQNWILIWTIDWNVYVYGYMPLFCFQIYTGALRVIFRLLMIFRLLKQWRIFSSVRERERQEIN